MMNNKKRERSLKIAVHIAHSVPEQFYFMEHVNYRNAMFLGSMPLISLTFLPHALISFCTANSSGEDAVLKNYVFAVQHI
jgi:hypothetical protein